MESEQAGPFVPVPRIDWSNFVRLAERVGVKPRPKDAKPSVVIVTQDGETYDVIEVLHAVLDQIEEKTRG